MFKKVVTESVRYGRRILDGIWQRGEHEVSKVPRHKEILQAQEIQLVQPVVRAQKIISSNGRSIVQRYMAQTNTKNLAAEMKKQLGFRFTAGSFPIFGRQNPGSLRQRLAMYGFVAVGVSSTGVQLDQDMLKSNEGVCNQIREFFSQKNKEFDTGDLVERDRVPHFEDFEFGRLIAKGCNAAVYEAKIKTDEIELDACDIHQCEVPEESMSFVAISESDDELTSLSSDQSDFTVISESSEYEGAPTFWTMEDIQEDDLISLHSEPEVNQCPAFDTNLPVEDSFELAIKVMFNYDAESNAASILRMMDKELIPAKMSSSLMQMDVWENGSHPKKKRRRLPPHPNLVDMMGAYVADMPDLPEGQSEYPHALPCRLYPDGYGRNQTMFLIMKRYDSTLREYLANNTLAEREKLLLFTQLIEGILHINSNEVAHRDLKSDNILLDLKGSEPHLVISDFGCCLAEENRKMWVPYQSDEVNKGGNGSLMAPEIATAQPGWLSYLDYAKSDIWAAGALGYEIFAGNNPFYRKRGARRSMENVSYKESELPAIPDAPKFIEAILKMMLRRDPKKRPSAENVLDMLHFVLWCPPEWLVLLDRAGRSRSPSIVKLRRWIEQLAIEVALEGNKATKVSNLMKRQFLSRVDAKRLYRSLSWLWNMSK